MGSFIWSAFVIGLVGNLHCVGMCGPIALIVPVKRSGRAQKALSILLYNLGRIAVYSALGALLGAFSMSLNIMGVQQHISILIGITMISIIVFPALSRKFNLINSTLFSGVSRLKKHFYLLVNKRTYFSIFLLGTLNGLLPCGLLYMALAGASLTGSALKGASYMMLFGIGTVPLMFAIPYLGHLITDKIQHPFKRLIPFTMIIFGTLLVLRGLNLGIDFISPEIVKGSRIIKCH